MDGVWDFNVLKHNYHTQTPNQLIKIQQHELKRSQKNDNYIDQVALKWIEKNKKVEASTSKIFFHGITQNRPYLSWYFSSATREKP